MKPHTTMSTSWLKNCESLGFVKEMKTSSRAIASWGLDLE